MVRQSARMTVNVRQVFATVEFVSPSSAPRLERWYAEMPALTCSLATEIAEVANCSATTGVCVCVESALISVHRGKSPVATCVRIHELIESTAEGAITSVAWGNPAWMGSVLGSLPSFRLGTPLFSAPSCSSLTAPTRKVSLLRS